MDSPSVPGGPRERNDMSASSIFFIAWMFIGSFFAMQLFVGVVVAQFNKIKAKKDGSATMTEDQRLWVETMRSMGGVKGKGKPRKPKTTGCVGLVDELLYRSITSPHYPAVVTIIVLINVMLLACDYWGFESEPPHPTREQTDSYVYEIVLEAYTVLFYLEALGKLRAYGSLFYFRDEWCRFELQLVGLSVVDQSQALYLISERVVPLPPMLLRVPRALYALRALRLMQHIHGVQSLVTTSVLSLPSLSNVCSILALLVFIFTVLGMQQFTYLRRGEHITDDRNYETFGNSLLVSLQCLTSDGWSSIMFEARSDPEHGSWRAVPFFLGFQVLVTVILNLVVAVILENFTSLGGANDELIDSKAIELFSETWADFDPDANQTIPAHLLPDLLKAIPQPVGLQGAPRTWVVGVCMNLGLQADENGELHFPAVLRALVKFNYMMHMEEGLGPAAKHPKHRKVEFGKEPSAEVTPRTGVPPSKNSRQSLLWNEGHAPTVEQRATARTFALELLRLTSGTHQFRQRARARVLARARDVKEGVKKEGQGGAIGAHGARLVAFGVDAEGGGLGNATLAKASSQGPEGAAQKQLGGDAGSAAAMAKGRAQDMHTQSHRQDMHAYAGAHGMHTQDMHTQKTNLRASGRAPGAQFVVVEEAADSPWSSGHHGHESVHTLRAQHDSLLHLHQAPSLSLSTSPTETTSVYASLVSRPPPSPQLLRPVLSPSSPNATRLAPFVSADGKVNPRLSESLKAKAIAGASEAIATANAALATAQAVAKQALVAEAAAAEAVARAEATAAVASIAAIVAEAEELQFAMQAAAAREDFAEAAAFKQALEPLRARLNEPENSPSPAAPAPAALASLASPSARMAGTLTLTLEGQLDAFSPQAEQAVLARLAALGGVHPSQLVVLSRRAGSVILEVAVLHSTYQRLKALSFLRALRAVTTEELSKVIGVPVLAAHCEFMSVEPQSPPSRPAEDEGAVMVEAMAAAEAEAMAEALAAAEAETRVPVAMPSVSPVLQNLLALEAQASRVPAAIASAANAFATIAPAASAPTAMLISEPARQPRLGHAPSAQAQAAEVVNIPWGPPTRAAIAQNIAAAAPAAASPMLGASRNSAASSTGPVHRNAPFGVVEADFNMKNESLDQSMASRIARRRLIGSQERVGQKSPTAVTLMGAGGSP